MNFLLWVYGLGEDVGRLLFELASQSRLSILDALQGEGLKTKEIARKLELTETETFRQLQRLNEALLVEKTTDGSYRATTYASLVLDNLASMDFIAVHRDHFLRHNASLLPIEFRTRLGELSGCDLIPFTLRTINKATEIYSGAEKRLDCVIMGTESILEISKKRIDDGVASRWIIHDHDIAEATEVFRSWTRVPEVRTVPRALGHIIVTEKAALFTIRENGGKMSYESFSGNKPSFMKWVSDLYEHEWQRAEPWSPRR